MEDDPITSEIPVMPTPYNPKAVNPVSGKDLLPSNRGGLILCIGIVGSVICCLGIILGPITIVMARTDLKRMKNGEINDSGRIAIVIGQILGILATLLGVAGIVASLLFYNWIASVDWERIDRNYDDFGMMEEEWLDDAWEEDGFLDPGDEPGEAWDIEEEDYDTRIPVEMDEEDGFLDDESVPDEADEGDPDP